MYLYSLVRFNTKEMARKNRILAPTKVIHFYGVPKESGEQDIMDLFGEYCAPPPAKVSKKILGFQIFFIVNTCYRSSLWRARRSGRRRPGPRRGPGWGSHTLTASR